MPSAVLKIPGRISNSSNELIYQARNISPLGYQSFYVKTELKNKDLQVNQSNNQTIEISNQVYNIQRIFGVAELKKKNQVINL